MLEKNHRYIRQITLPEIGYEGQDKITAARILVVGAGGLGCPALISLVSMGIGHIGIVDFDRIALSNLHRQQLYLPEHIGQFKSEIAAQQLTKMESGTQIKHYKIKITPENIFALLANYDIILDGTDNFETRYVINDACAIAGKPLIFGAVHRFESQVSVFNVKDENGIEVNYRHLFPEIPSSKSISNCEEAGVTGILTAITGNMMAAEVLKLLVGTGQPMANKLLTYDMKSGKTQCIQIAKNQIQVSSLPKSEQELLNTNYSIHCPLNTKQLISWNETIKLVEKESYILIDIREDFELPAIPHVKHIRRPGISAEELILNYGNKKPMVIACASGKRSEDLLNKVNLIDASIQIFSLQDGVKGIQS